MFKVKNLANTKALAVIALLTAANVVIGLFLQIHTWDMKISMAFLTIAFAAYFFGPVAAMLVSGMADVLGVLCAPQAGAYFPGFTLTALITGCCFGIFLYKDTPIFKNNKYGSYIRICIAVVFNELVGTALMNTFWISFMFGAPFSGLFIKRITTQIPIMIAIEIVTLSIFFGKSMVIDRIGKAIRK